MATSPFIKSPLKYAAKTSQAMLLAGSQLQPLFTGMQSVIADCCCCPPTGSIVSCTCTLVFVHERGSSFCILYITHSSHLYSNTSCQCSSRAFQQFTYSRVCHSCGVQGQICTQCTVGHRTGRLSPCLFPRGFE